MIFLPTQVQSTEIETYQVICWYVKLNQQKVNVTVGQVDILI